MLIYQFKIIAKLRRVDGLEYESTIKTVRREKSQRTVFHS